MASVTSCMVLARLRFRSTLAPTEQEIQVFVQPIGECAPHSATPTLNISRKCLCHDNMMMYCLSHISNTLPEMSSGVF